MSDQQSRRHFVRTLTLGASAATLSAPGELAAEDDVKKDEPPKTEPAPSETDARMDLILARFGKHLDADARQKVRAAVEGIVHRAEGLRQFPLTNGDGPFPVFTPYRAPLDEA